MPYRQGRDSEKKPGFRPKVGMLYKALRQHFLTVEDINEINMEEKRNTEFYKKLTRHTASIDEQRKFLKDSIIMSQDFNDLQNFSVEPGDVAIAIKIYSNTPQVSLNSKVHTMETYVVILVNEKISKVTSTAINSLYEEVK